MRIGVISEMSTAHRNADIMGALRALGHDPVNIGMHDRDEPEEQKLSYLETGFLTGLMLNLGRVDFVVGGCGTGCGYINSALAYPNVFAAVVKEPLDGWLFIQINAGNCVSLVLNEGYGWGGEMNLQFIFEKLFIPELIGRGFPPERREPQKDYRDRLKDVSITTRRSMAESVETLDRRITRRALHYPGVWESVAIDTVADERLKDALLRAYV